jgi:cytidylate kinase
MMIIAIDGPAATGKSTTAKIVAKKLGYTYLDTGAMYRCVTLAFLNDKVNLDDTQLIQKILDEIEIQIPWTYSSPPQGLRHSGRLCFPREWTPSLNRANPAYLEY